MRMPTPAAPGRCRRPALRQRPFFGDLGVGQSARELPEHFELAFGEAFETVSGDRGGPGRAPAGLRSGSRSAMASSSRRVTLGATTASPLATARIEEIRPSGGTYFSRNPLAPALRPGKAYSST